MTKEGCNNMHHWSAMLFIFYCLKKKKVDGLTTDLIRETRSVASYLRVVIVIGKIKVNCYVRNHCCANQIHINIIDPLGLISDNCSTEYRLTP